MKIKNCTFRFFERQTLNVYMASPEASRGKEAVRTVPVEAAKSPEAAKAAERKQAIETINKSYIPTALPKEAQKRVGDVQQRTGEALSALDEASNSPEKVKTALQQQAGEKSREQIFLAVAAVGDEAGQLVVGRTTLSVVAGESGVTAGVKRENIGLTVTAGREGVGAAGNVIIDTGSPTTITAGAKTGEVGVNIANQSGQFGVTKTAEGTNVQATMPVSGIMNVGFRAGGGDNAINLSVVAGKYGSVNGEISDKGVNVKGSAEVAKDTKVNIGLGVGQDKTTLGLGVDTKVKGELVSIATALSAGAGEKMATVDATLHFQ